MSDPGPGQAHLSPRQREIVELIAQGFGDKQIADELQISIHTVDFHVRVLFEKFGVSSRGALVLRYLHSTIIAKPPYEFS